MLSICNRKRLLMLGFTLIEVLLALAILGTLAAIVFPQLHDAIDKARTARAIGDIRALQADLASYDAAGKLPASLAAIGRGTLKDPWGHPYKYLPFPPKKGGGGAPPSGARKDRFLVPINSTYDLCSMGKDGATSAPLTAKAGRDDIVRANDGAFIGVASKY